MTRIRLVFSGDGVLNVLHQLLKESSTGKNGPTKHANIILMKNTKSQTPPSWNSLHTFDL